MSSAIAAEPQRRHEPPDEHDRRVGDGVDDLEHDQHRTRGVQERANTCTQSTTRRRAAEQHEEELSEDDDVTDEASRTALDHSRAQLPALSSG